ncbi:hypothetical protein [Melghirimyces algeriensis]|uniref:Uncharacterized protein n=1 Tax=Melghirimyces algeriensis TaxID=910412 RepID=A0A521B8P2_9BACL|nr:hypothetical protein [Melghirimyces algeriensis]SMO43425.1 hypothetical protein SAMN06264849_101615 [Melghirimyces algeriensis]
MGISFSSGWDLIQYELQQHFSDEEMEKIQAYMQSESWISPTCRNRWCQRSPLEMPLRFHLDVDLKM